MNVMQVRNVKGSSHQFVNSYKTCSVYTGGGGSVATIFCR